MRERAPGLPSQLVAICCHLLPAKLRPLVKLWLVVSLAGGHLMRGVVPHPGQEGLSAYMSLTPPTWADDQRRAVAESSQDGQEPCIPVGSPRPQS